MRIRVKGVAAVAACLLAVVNPAGAAERILTLHVNNAHPQANDRHPGSETAPLATLGQALEYVFRSQEGCTEAVIIIHPGSYRESVQRTDGRELRIPLTIAAADSGAAVFTGADVWDGWRSQPGKPWLIHDWQYRWGLGAIPKAPEKIKQLIAPPARRREMLFVNGILQRQALELHSLAPGSYFVDEEPGLLYLQPPDDVDVERAVIEVALRDTLLRLDNFTDLTVRGLVFRAAASPFNGSAVTFAGCHNLTLESCRFEWNNWRGLKIGTSQLVTVRNCSANHNGGTGYGIWKVSNLTLSGCETSYNNWRGASGGFDIWAVAGAKLMLLHQADIIGFKAVGNLTRGLWLDTDNRDVVVEGAELKENTHDGLFIEVSQGPVLVRNCRIEANAKYGVRINSSDRVTLVGDTIGGNALGQIIIQGAGREISDWETGEKLQLDVSDLHLQNNTATSRASGQPLIEISVNPLKWNKIKSSLSSDGNRWLHPDAGEAFLFPSAFGAKRAGLDEWRRATGQDTRSTFNSP